MDRMPNTRSIYRMDGLMKIKDRFKAIKARIPEMEMAEICDEIGGGRPYVSYLCRTAGIRPKHFNDRWAARRFKDKVPEMAGKTKAEIMAMVGCSWSYMLHLCRANGVVPTDKWLRIFWDEIVEGVNFKYKTNHETVKGMLEWLYAKYPSSFAIGAVLGICHQTILTKMKELGIKILPWKNRNAEQRRAWQAQRQQFLKPIL